jgi:hypothetical protein
MKKILISGILTLTLAAAVFAKKDRQTVTIIQRQDNPSTYVYTVPGYSRTDCRQNFNNSECTNTDTPAQTGSYTVSGATLALQLVDGRVAVVNCQAKINRLSLAPRIEYRSCRQPLIDTVEVEFNGDHAKLFWPVSIDGKKTTNETYTIIGILYKKS